jgi:ATP-dependent DNA helicase RecQ
LEIDQFPSISNIARIYESIYAGSFIPMGEGTGNVLEVNVEVVCKSLNLKPQQITSALALLEREGYLQLVEPAEDVCYIKLRSEPKYLRNMVVSKKAIQLCERILRKIPGIVDETKGIRMEQLRRWTYAETDEPWKVLLLELQERGALNFFLPEPNRFIIRLLSERVPKSHVRLSHEVYGLRKKIAEDKLKAIEQYAFDSKECRLVKLLDYFGESEAADCGQCDVCRSKGRSLSMDEILRAARNEKLEWRLEEMRDRFPTLMHFNDSIFREWLEAGLIQELKPGAIRFNIEPKQLPK